MHSAKIVQQIKIIKKYIFIISLNLGIVTQILKTDNEAYKYNIHFTDIINNSNFP